VCGLEVQCFIIGNTIENRANGFLKEVELEFKQMFLCCPNIGCAPKFKVIK
jgi:hypothetical protein